MGLLEASHRREYTAFDGKLVLEIHPEGVGTLCRSARRPRRRRGPTPQSQEYRIPATHK